MKGQLLEPGFFRIFRFSNYNHENEIFSIQKIVLFTSLTNCIFYVSKQPIN